MTRESHPLRVLAGVEFEDMEEIAGSGCEVLSSVGELDVGAVFEGVYVLEVAERLAIFLEVEDSEFVGVGDHQVQT